MPPRNLVVLEDGLIRSMAADQRFTSAFPFLGNLRGSEASCGRCGRRRRNADQAVALAAARRSLANLSTDKKKKLLELLNARQVRIRYQEGGQTVIKTIRGDQREDS